MSGLLKCNCGYKRAVSSKLSGRVVKCPSCGQPANVVEVEEEPVVPMKREPRLRPPNPLSDWLAQTEYSPGTASQVVIDHGHRMAGGAARVGLLVCAVSLIVGASTGNVIGIAATALLGAAAGFILFYVQRLIGSLFVVFGELEQNTRDTGIRLKDSK